MSQALILSCWNLNQPAFGGGRRASALLELLGRRVILCQPAPSHPSMETATFVPDLGKRRLGINWGIFNYFLPTTARRVQRLIRDYHPPVVLLTSMWNYYPLRNQPAQPVVLDAHDFNAQAVGERLGSQHPFTRMVRAWEAYVLRRVDHIFACSEHNREQFLAAYGVPSTKVSVAPNGVDLAQFSEPHEPLDPKVAQALSGKTVLFFMGKLNYQPNAAGLHYLLNTIMPELERQASGRFQLLVCGGPIPSGLSHPSTIFTGLVSTAQLVACLHRADICLSPTFTGSGTRLKILEYWACRKPVIATPKGVEGLTCASGQPLLLSDPADFAPNILALSRQPERAAALANAGYERARQYDWKIAAHPAWRAGLSPWLAV